MRAAIFGGPRQIEVGTRPDPTIQAPTDAIVRGLFAGVCGSDLWYYRGESVHDLGAIGHEFIGVIEEVGSEVRALAAGVFVVTPFTWADGTCVLCRAGWTSNCLHGGGFGNHGIDGGQGEFVRVQFADATLVAVPGGGKGLSHDTIKSLVAIGSARQLSARAPKASRRELEGTGDRRVISGLGG
jgi:threonine dehydrogenase-like Zn-dependent dehydrogenase